LAAGGDRPRSNAVKLSTKGRYAVMAMVDLARNSNGNPVALADIATRQEISLSYLEQLFAKLRKGALVKSVRGPGGGYLLAHPEDQTRISDIIIAVDEPIQATRCKAGSSAGCRSNKSRCLTHDLWQELGNQIHLYLSAVTLSDVVNRRILGTSGLRVPVPNGTPPVEPVQAVQPVKEVAESQPTAA
jgi:Rrf2 family transcriptional regulator, iron-sulfur cluster assembly transcription factor